MEGVPERTRERRRGTSKQQQLAAPPGDADDARWRGERRPAIPLRAMATTRGCDASDGLCFRPATRRTGAGGARGLEEERRSGHWGSCRRWGLGRPRGRDRWRASETPGRAGLFSDPWIKCGFVRGPRALDGTDGRDRATSARSDGRKSKAL
jgi:hypothetical protein